MGGGFVFGLWESVCEIFVYQWSFGQRNAADQRSLWTDQISNLPVFKKPPLVSRLSWPGSSVPLPQIIQTLKKQKETWWCVQTVVNDERRCNMWSCDWQLKGAGSTFKFTLLTVHKNWHAHSFGYLIHIGYIKSLCSLQKVWHTEVSMQWVCTRLFPIQGMLIHFVVKQQRQQYTCHNCSDFRM